MYGRAIRWSQLLVLALLVVQALQGCTAEGFECRSASDCSADKQCSNGWCRPVAPTGCQPAGQLRCASATVLEQCQTDGTWKSSPCAAQERCDTAAGACKKQVGCGADEDCKGQPAPYCSDAKRCEWQCRNDVDCQTGENCVAHICQTATGCQRDADCQDPQKPRCDDQTRTCHRCVRDGDCQPNERCQQHGCIASSECKADTDCKDAAKPKCDTSAARCVACLASSDCIANQECVAQICRTKAECTGDQDCTNPFKSFCDTALQLCVECTEKSHCRDSTKPLCRQRVCAEDPRQVRQFGETCGLFSSHDPGYNDCLPTLHCYRNRCRKPCDPKKPAPGDCAANQWCYKDTLGSVCLERCDPQNGIIGKDCPAGSFCSAMDANYDPGFCDMLPYLRQGAQQLGQECSNYPTHASQYCDGSKGLYCDSTCRKACDPAKGTITNPACTAQEECVITLGTVTSSPLGGGCVAKPTQKQGESCDYPNSRCLAGLRCIENRCYPTCDPTKTGECGAKQVCHGSIYDDICLDTCDATKGAFGGGCPGDHFCLGTSKGGGRCYPLPRKQQGPQQLGESCLNTRLSLACDGSKGLYCFNDTGTMTCHKACDPRKGNADCGTGTCIEEPYQSYLGGICRAPATQTLGAYCDPSQRCLQGLTCEDYACRTSCTSTADCKGGQICDSSDSICVSQCDPAKGKFTTECPAGFVCQAASGSLSPGYCKALSPKQQGPKTKGADCSYNYVKGANACDGSKGLFCHFAQFVSACLQACDLRNGDADCGAQESCIEETFTSFLGGMCVPKGTLPVGASCDQINNRCQDGLRCHLNKCYTYCQSDKDCGGGQGCLPAEGVCVDKCDPTQGMFSSTCQPGFFCRKDSFAFKPGFCMWLAPKRQGPKRAGEVCSTTFPSLYCDGSAQLFCHEQGGQNLCQTACDPRQKGTDCPSGKSCVEELTNSYLGGICQ